VPPLDEAPNNPLLARLAGFSLHAATVCGAHQRSRLERLCRYITRPPIATKRLSVDHRGRVLYRYKQPFRDGSTHVVLEPLDFIARLAAIERSGKCKAAVALANKNVRTAWAMLTQNTEYQRYPLAA